MGRRHVLPLADTHPRGRRDGPGQSPPAPRQGRGAGARALVVALAAGWALGIPVRAAPSAETADAPALLQPGAMLPFSTDPAWPRADWLLLGEEHDARQHQQLAAHVVQRLAGRGRLAALALEMAEAGRSTAGLPADATEAAARAALAWQEAAWPWAAYGPLVMEAVRAGVPVHGANLPRSAMREAMEDTRLDHRVDPALRERLQRDVADSHCHLLPAAKLPAMTRVQIGRDLQMARTLAHLRQPGRVVMLVAGNYHVDAELGVPRHLAALAEETGPGGGRIEKVRMSAGAATDAAPPPGYDRLWPTPAVERPADPCAELRPAAGAASAAGRR